MLNSLAFLVLLAGGDAERSASQPDNGPCYVCHQGLSKEKITSVHLKEEIGCVDCHGPSTHHMHDEMLMTKPDILFGRTEVVPACRKCHGEHEHPEKVAKFLREWYGRDRPNGRVINEHSICTDCHGRHNIAKESVGREQESEGEDWTDLFDGESLDTWEGKGAGWQVRSKRIEGRPAAGGELALRKAVSLGDFRFYLTFRLTEKQHAEFFWRGKNTRRIILSSGRDGAGSLLVGERLAVLNPISDAVDPEGWNTLSLAAGEFLCVWLNGKEVYRLRRERSTTSEVGFRVRGEAEGAILEIREVRVQKLKGEG